MYGKGFYTGDPCVRYSNGYYYIMTSETHSDGSLLGGQVRSISCAAAARQACVATAQQAMSCVADRSAPCAVTVTRAVAGLISAVVRRGGRTTSSAARTSSTGMSPSARRARREAARGWTLSNQATTESSPFPPGRAFLSPA